MSNSSISNESIAEQLSLYAKLLDIHGLDAFRSKSYANASFQIDRLSIPAESLAVDEIAKQKGIGGSIAAKIIEIIDKGSFSQLDELLMQTPEGVLQLMQIKGLGAKKINTIWHEMGIESPGELLYACQENRLILYKGFGAKTQQNVQESIEFMMKQAGKLLLADAMVLAEEWERQLIQVLPNGSALKQTGALARGDDTVEVLEWLVVGDESLIKDALHEASYTVVQSHDGIEAMEAAAKPLPIRLYLTEAAHAGTVQVITTQLPAFREALEANRPGAFDIASVDDVDFFAQHKMLYVPTYLRTLATFATKAATTAALPDVVRTEQIRGIIHSHSTYSDGADTIEAMALAAKAEGFEYLVISDHSKTAIYAGGLQPDRILAQHEEIDRINAQIAPFKIFKSIESDILHDGSLDYEPSVLASFDLVIASVHSGLKMPEEKAMARLMAAIENPFTTILGHPTGRLLLSRKGYPIDHNAIIKACVANKVVIEINAHPRRLDLDWSWIPAALDAGAMLSINPDAHWIGGFKDVQYGVLAARKGGLTADRNLSSFSLQAFEQWVEDNRKH